MAQLQPIVWIAIWCVGCVLSLAIIAFRQGRFAHALGRLHPRDDLGDRVFGAESCALGPAVVGVLRPIIVTPADFDERFSDEERRIVLAHERAHLAQGDPLINAIVVALQCLNWFNPFIHLGARAMRLDQELAADAAVLATSARRPYAEAILKTQIMAAAPLGAAWPPNSAQSLKERIAMLKRTLPNRTQRLLGVSAVAIATASVCAAAWAAQPAHVVVAKAQHIARADAAPFIEPPITDRSQLAGAPQTHPEWRLADAQGEPTDYAVADSGDDQRAGGGADEPVEASANEDSDNDAILSAADLRDIDQAGDRLSPQERERIRAAVAQVRAAARVMQSQAVREAMAQSRVAIAEARAATREARIEGERAAIAAAREMNSPEMQAELRAMTTEAARMARDTRVSEQERMQMRAELRSHADRLRALARRNCVRVHTSHAEPETPAPAHQD